MQYWKMIKTLTNSFFSTILLPTHFCTNDEGKFSRDVPFNFHFVMKSVVCCIRPANSKILTLVLFALFDKITYNDKNKKKQKKKKRSPISVATDYYI